MDALRYWVQEMHVDGFRFDLAPRWGAARATSTRSGRSSRRSARIRCWPASSSSPSRGTSAPAATGWATSRRGWSEWNGRYRDGVRDFWRGHGGMLAGVRDPRRGLGDLYGHGGRRPTASINLVTSHDGFTLADLVSYDGSTTRPTARTTVTEPMTTAAGTAASKARRTTPPSCELRARQRRNLLATLLLSQGVPMLLGGDELGRTQGGNNNAYCQDNADQLVRLGCRRGAGGPDDFMAACARCAAATRPSAAGSS